MGMCKYYRWLVVPLFLFATYGGQALGQVGATDAKRLGNLEFRITRADQTTLVADGRGFSSNSTTAQVDFNIKNVGGFPICARFLPIVEEYKNSDIGRTEPIKRRFPYHEIDHLAPGEESVGHVSFRMPFARRTYVLALELLSRNQQCSHGKSQSGEALSGGTAVRLPVPQLNN